MYVDLYVPGGSFKQFYMFTPILGEMIQFYEYFSNELKPPTSILCHLLLSSEFLLFKGPILKGICSEGAGLCSTTAKQPVVDKDMLKVTLGSIV